jgi:putative transposase
MPFRKVQSIGSFYHVYNRGVEKRTIFLDDEDRLRFIHDLYELNDKDYALNVSYYFEYQSNRGLSEEKIKKVLRELQIEKQRKLLVDIASFCMMPNHFHFILSPKVENGISLFMQKFGVGYTRYFNYKYHRVGPLFQGRYKAKHISDDTYLKHCTGYIHRNPLELMTFAGKRTGIQFRKAAENFLSAYRWSSHPDFIGIKNFPSVIHPNFIMNMFDNNNTAYKKLVFDWTEEDYARLNEAKLLFEE